MKVLIFGGNGFLGKELNKLLKSVGYEVYNASRSKNDTDFKVDISESNDLNALPTDFFDIIINCATILPGGDYLDSDYLNKIYKTNILGTQNICNWLKGQKKIKKIINCSTLVVVKKPWPINFDEDVNTYPHGKHVLYSFSKLGQELLFRTYADSNNVSLSQIRFSALYGANMSSFGIINNIINQVKNTNIIRLSNATKVNADFLHIEDAAKIILSVIKSDFNGVLNAASGFETSILQLAEIIKKNFNDEKIKIVNLESNDDFEEDRALICLKELKQIIDVDSFISLEEGIKKILS